MTVEFQTSLFDTAAVPQVGRLAETVRRRHLSHGAWVDVRPGWVTGSEELFARLVSDVPWYAERRTMWDNVVDVPRLLRFYDEHSRDELGERFVSAGMCFYRDGRDSVAWHGDTHGRSSTSDTMVAILSLGEARRL